MSNDIRMDIQGYPNGYSKSTKNWRLISIKARISIYACGSQCPCMDIPAWISMWISDIARIITTDTQKSWISMLISVGFWESVYGYAISDQGPLLTNSYSGEVSHRRLGDCLAKRLTSKAKGTQANLIFAVVSSQPSCLNKGGSQRQKIQPLKPAQ